MSAPREELRLQNSETVQSLLDALRHEGMQVERPRQIYCNRDLNMAKVEAVGFDMDYTLAPYIQDELDALSVRVTLERLVSHRGYPKEILKIEPRPDFAIRGLVVDKQKGHIFKMDAHRHVGKGYHGFRELEDSERHEYRNSTIRLNSDHRFALIDTLFALPEAFLYAALVDWHETTKPGADHDFVQIFDDIRFSIDLAHRDDSIKDEIMSDIGRFITRSRDLALSLHKLRSAGKKLFVLTNSYARYTEKVMSYLLDGMLPEYSSWRRYFDICITGARKPSFFTEQNPFFEVDANAEVVSNDVRALRRGHLYQGGNLLEFERLSGLGGETLVYVGDHIYGDIVRSKKSSAWRTVMIVQEMEDELRRVDELREDIARLDEWEREVLRLNEELAFDQSLDYRLDKLLTAGDLSTAFDPEMLKKARDEIRTRRDSMKRRRAALVRQMEDTEDELETNFNQYWGLIFKQGNENTLFGEQVEDYACLYTSRVSNFVNYSPLHYFRGPRQLMPHERY